MLKKYLLIVLIAFSVTPQTVFAIEYSNSSSSAAKSGIRPIKTAVQELNAMKKDAMQDYKAARQAALQDFKTKIAGIKDERKKAIATNIDTRIANANENLTAKMDAALDKLSQIIERLKTKSAALIGEGKDTTELDAAIAEAETAITNAQTAVDTQMAKIYTANVTTDETLGSVIGAMVRLFKSDIQSTHNAVKDAHKAVRAAWVAGAKLSGDGTTATPSAAIQL